MKSWQIFMKGDVDAVLRQCSSVWDGQELRPMLAEDVQLIQQHCSECYQKHYRCVAFSYVSVDPERRDLIKACSQLGRSVFLDQVVVSMTLPLRPLSTVSPLLLSSFVFHLHPCIHLWAACSLACACTAFAHARAHVLCHESPSDVVHAG